MTIVTLRHRYDAEARGCTGCPYREAQTCKPLIIGRLVLFNEQATWDGKDVGLTHSEYRILHKLATMPGQWITNRQIYDIVHYVGFVAGIGDTGYRANVRSLIKRIRHKFIALDPAFDRIENFPSVGYRFVP